jgi:uncharacterized protein YndB with AHSA1/START domain
VVRVTRTDSASHVMAAAVDQVYAALVDRDALLAWLPPDGMRASFERFDARPGGSYRLVLTYPDSSAAPGKAGADSDVVEARFVDLVPGVRVVQAVDFESTDPAYSGTMTMTWELTEVAGGTRVDIRAENVPVGISAKDHAAGLTSSLENLANFLQDHDPSPLKLFGHAVSLERLAYATVVLMSILVVYDGWASLTTFGGIAIVIIAPTLAVLLAHLFADVLHLQAEHRRLLDRGQLGALLRHQLGIVFAAVPPLVILLLGWITPMDALNTISVLIWTGMVTLVGLTAFSAYHAGLRGWRLVAAGVAGGLVGLVVISMQVLLKPG